MFLNCPPNQKFTIVTRHAHDVIIANHRHNRLYKINSLNYKVGITWNALLFQVKQKSIKFKIGTFKRAVKTFIYQNMM